MNREMNTGLLEQAQNAGSTQETMRRLEELFARGCYDDLTAAQHERLDRIDNNNPAIRQAINNWADRCFRPYYDDRPDGCEKHREPEPEHDCAECRVPLDDRSQTLCGLCQWYRDYYAANGCEDCGGRLSATDRADFRFSCRPCRQLNEQLFYTSLARQARTQTE